MSEVVSRSFSSAYRFVFAGKMKRAAGASTQQFADGQSEQKRMGGRS
jgi:hypothetical protein